MNKTILILIIVIILIILIGGYFIFYNGNQGPMYGTSTPGNTNFTPNTSTTPIANTPAPSIQPLADLSASVSIKDFSFNPTPLNIKVGTTVTWTNNDSVPHQIKSGTFNSAVLTSGQTFLFTFSSAGTYNYSCAIHPSMNGQVVVTQ
jgi:plastocyanin